MHTTCLHAQTSTTPKAAKGDESSRVVRDESSITIHLSCIEKLYIGWGKNLELAKFLFKSVTGITGSL